MQSPNERARLSIVMLGATGAVGSEVVRALLSDPSLEQLTLLGRRSLEGVQDDRITQHRIDIFDPASYQRYVHGHHCAICTLGVGQPSKMDKAEFLQIDKHAVQNFAALCSEAGIEHFQLLSSVGANARSRSFYLRSKGELQDGIRALGFKRLSVFQPSMILTETNRYGFLQAATLALWPIVSHFLPGPLRKYRGIHVAQLGNAIAMNVRHPGSRFEILQWPEFVSLTK
ncbi:MAG: NAD(P)H-binding protein [Granulosicoccus sp.]|nr:NAD(P)H-binding protein [Granulosicoccus sp.]